MGMAAVSEDAAEVESEIKLTRLSTEGSEGIVWLSSSQVSSAASTRSKLHKSPWPRVGRADGFDRCPGTARPTELRRTGPTDDSVENEATEEGPEPVSSYYGSDLSGAAAQGGTAVVDGSRWPIRSKGTDRACGGAQKKYGTNQSAIGGSQ